MSRFVEVCNAVAYAHSRGVLHRDIKPGNIMLGKFGETWLIDWGLAKAGVGRENSELRIQNSESKSQESTETDEATLRPSAGSGMAETVAGVAMGTPAFMSPEQASGRVDELGPASDIYSLGATLYMLLTGKPPFERSEIAEVLTKVQRGDFATPRQVNPATPRGLDAICRKAMALKPEDRYATATDLAGDVEHWLADEPVAAQRESFAGRLGRWYRRNTRVAGLLAALAVVLGVAAVGMTYLWLVADKEHKRGTAAFEEILGILDRYHNVVLGHPRLDDPEFRSLRNQLLSAEPDITERVSSELGHRPDLRLRVASAWYRVFEIRTLLGETTGAQHAHQRAFNIYKGLVDEDPNDLEAILSYANMLPEEYSSTYEDLSLGERKQKALRLKRSLVDRAPDNFLYKLSLAHNLLFLGIDHFYEGNPRFALRDFTECVQLREWCIEHGLDNEMNRRLQAQGLGYLARAQYACNSGDYRATEAKACTILEQILDGFPGSKAARYVREEYANLYIGSMLRGEIGLACFYEQRGFDAARRNVEYLVQNREPIIELRRSMILEGYNLGIYFGKRINNVDNCSTIARLLHPTGPVGLTFDIGSLLMHLPAKSGFSYAVEQCALLPPRDHKIGELPLCYVEAMSLFNIGETEKAFGQREKTLPFWRRAFTKLPEVAKHYSEQPELLEHCIELCRQFAEELAVQNQPDEAMDVLRKAVELGYKGVHHLRTSKEFEPLRSRADFKELVKALEGKAE